MKKNLLLFGVALALLSFTHLHAQTTCPSPSAEIRIDVDPGTQVVTQTPITLTGTAERHTFPHPDCFEVDIPLTQSWSIELQRPDGTRLNIIPTVNPPDPLRPEVSVANFVPRQEGTFAVTLTGVDTETGFRASAQRTIRVTQPCTNLKATGKVTFLRVNDMGLGFGPPEDHIDVEVVTKLNVIPELNLGFQLRNDANQPARNGMLNLLRDGFVNNKTVSLDYCLIQTTPRRKNGILFRVELLLAP